MSYHSLLPIFMNWHFFSFCSCELTLCWSRGLSSKRRNDSTRKHNNDFIEPEVKIVSQPLWAPYVSEATSKEMSYFGDCID